LFTICPFRYSEKIDESQSRDYHHLLFPVQLDAARQLDGAGAAAHVQHRYRSVTLVPGTGGIFTITVDDVQIWERKQDEVSRMRRSSSAGYAMSASRKVAGARR
jgi:hypothetical protein